MCLPGVASSPGIRLWSLWFFLQLCHQPTCRDVTCICIRHLSHQLGHLLAARTHLLLVWCCQLGVPLENFHLPVCFAVSLPRDAVFSKHLACFAVCVRLPSSVGLAAPGHGRRVWGGTAGTEANDASEDAHTAAAGDRVLGLVEPLLTETL